MKNLTWQNPEQLFVAQELINKVKSKCCGIKVYLTLCFTSLFTLMDPLGVMPVFLQMTDGMDTKERRYIALKACTIAFIILVLFILSGRFLFHFFGISTDGFRIVGGIIIFKIGYDMLQAHFTHVKLNETERKEYSKDITITPLAIPIDRKSTRLNSSH